MNTERIKFNFNVFNKHSAIFANDEINKRIELFNKNKTKLYSYSFNCDIDNKLS